MGIPIIEKEHLEGFFLFLSRQTELLPIVNDALQIANLDEKEKAIAKALDNQIGHWLSRYFSEYNNSFPSNCLRCTKSFSGLGQDYCKLCGWDYINSLYLDDESLDNAIENQNLLNSEWIISQVGLLIYKEEIKNIENLNIQNEKQIKNIQLELNHLNLIHDHCQRQLEQNQKKSSDLNKEKNILEQEFSEKSRLKDENDVLFQPNSDSKPSILYKLALKQEYLFVEILSMDQNAKDIRKKPDILISTHKSPPSHLTVVGDAIMHKRIFQQFEQVEGHLNIWRVSLNEILKDLNEEQFYLSASVMHKKETKIELRSNKDVFQKPLKVK